MIVWVVERACQHSPSSADGNGQLLFWDARNEDTTVQVPRLEPNALALAAWPASGSEVEWGKVCKVFGSGGIDTSGIGNESQASGFSKPLSSGSASSGFRPTVFKSLQTLCVYPNDSLITATFVL